MKIPVARPYLGDEEAEAVREVLASGWITQGPKVEEFERRFAACVGSAFAVAVTNCTAALGLSLLAAEIGAGDEVICPSLSFIASANAIRHVGARPVFAEIDHATGNLDPADVERRITPRTRAVMVVHQIGMPADLEAFGDICRRRGLHLVEDAACAIGSEYRGRRIGSHSDLVCFSFHPRKVISTGEGGMITTSREDYTRKLRLLRHHGMSVSDRERHTSHEPVIEEYVLVGYNQRLTDIQAAIGIKQLERLDWLLSERRRLADLYLEGLRGAPHLRLPAEPAGTRTNWQSFSVYLQPSAPLSRARLMQRLMAAGIATRRGVMTIHREKAYRDDYPDLVLPVTEDLSDRSVILPLFVGMTDDQVAHVVGTLRASLAP
jgi:perosamine synthetase